MSDKAFEELTARILIARRRRLFGSTSIFEQYKQVTASDLDSLESQLGHALPNALRIFLLIAGYGDLNGSYFGLRQEFFSVIETGELANHVMFAQDELGNFYAYSCADGAIFFIERHAPEHARLADNFETFLEELERRSFDLQGWTDSLKVLPYTWQR